MGRLWYQKPAKEWEEALPLGNGRMGAMIFGDPFQERIQVNEESIWLGGKRERMNPDARVHLEDIRRLIFEGQIKKAHKLLNMAFAGCPDSMSPYQTLGDIHLVFEGQGKVENYQRSLELDEAVCRISYTLQGVTYSREAFFSKPDDCLVMKITADRKKSICLAARLERGKYFDNVGKLGEQSIYLDGNLGEGGNSFIFGLKAVPKGGILKLTGQTLSIENADEVVLFFSSDTLWHYMLQEEKGVSLSKTVVLKDELEKILVNASAYSYEQLLGRHMEDYRSLYDRVELCLSEDEKYDKIPTDERLKAVGKGEEDAGMYQILFQYGRYLLICCSRPEGLPANLQGIWNQEFLPPWDSKYTININMEMNYWLAESCNLSECHLPLFTLLKKMRESGRRMAEGMYGCRGFMAHHNTDIHGDCAPQDTWPGSTYWVMGAAWLCTHIWNHYEYTMDQKFLEEFYPVMCEAALFFLDYLVEKDRYLVTCPSSSPENEYRLPNGETGNVTYGATMDNQILKDLFRQCLLSSEVLKQIPDADCRIRSNLDQIGIRDENAFLGQIQDAMGKLAPVRIGSEGTVMEWIEEYEECEPGHRHISHLYGLHPSDQITVDGTPELAKAARKTLENRLLAGGGHTGWSRAWIINHYAKLWDGESAHFHLEKLLELSMYPNLFDRHPPFQIDGNFGAAAAIAEMLVQSSMERIILLPALPMVWKNGYVRGLKIRGNAEIDLYWEEHSLTKCVIRAYSDISNNVMYKGKYFAIKLTAGESITMDSMLKTEKTITVKPKAELLQKT